jgi:hypothetical protein
VEDAAAGLTYEGVDPKVVFEKKQVGPCGAETKLIIHKLCFQGPGPTNVFLLKPFVCSSYPRALRNRSL